jgi:DNA (cytosine-5)-methyltransferase 1
MILSMPPSSTRSAQCFQQNTRDEVRLIGGNGEIAGALSAEPGMKQQNYVKPDNAVRRLTPTECERLQGFPDNWTVPTAPDTAR